MPPKISSIGRRPKFDLGFKMVSFRDAEIYTYLDRKAKVAMEAVGRLLARKARRNIKQAKRYRSINQVKNPKERMRYRMQEREYNEGTRPTPPLLPFRPSKPGAKYPFSRSKYKPLKMIEPAYDRLEKELIVGAVPYARGKMIAPRVLEHGGTSNGSVISKRPFMRNTLKAEKSNGNMAAVFRQKLGR